MSLVVPLEEIFAKETGLLAKHDSWERVELGKACKILNGFPFKSSLFNSSEGFPVIRIRDIARSSTETFYNGKFPPEYVVKKGDLLIGMDGNFRCCEWLGRDAGLNQRVCKIIPDEKILHRQFLFYGLNGYLKAIEDVTSSVTVGHLSSRDVQRIPFPLPPLAEQQRIVTTLEAMLGKLDASQQRLEKMPTLLKRFRQSILAAACSGRLTADWREENPAKEIARTDDSTEGFAELPETWQWQKIGGVFTVETGTTPPKKDPANYSPTPSDCPFFKPSDLDVGAEVRIAREWLSAQGEDYSRLLPAMTICVTSIGATIGKTGLLRVCGATNQQINSILPTKAVQPEFTYYYCCSQYFQRRILEESSSTTLPIINKGRFVELEFPLPPLAEQQEIVRRVEGLFALADQLELRLAQARRQVDKLTPSLLARAFAGQLVPQNPDDEPAAKLLERFHAQA